MKTKIVAVLCFLALSTTARAQTCQFSCQLGATANVTWTGSTAGNEVQFTTIDNQSTDQRIGFAGGIEISGGNSLSILTLPEPGTCSIPRNPDGSCSGETFPGFPNNGSIVYYATTITWGAKQWGTRADGTTMDGTQAGDSYTQTGTTECPQWNGTTDVTLTVFRQMVKHQNCGRFGCRPPYLVDTMFSGSGTATVVQ